MDSTGLYYYGARYYDPQIGRFISADTIVPNPNNPQSLNRYSYCRNNPLNSIDPSGHWDFKNFVKGIGESIAGAVESAIPVFKAVEAVKTVYQLCTKQTTIAEINQSHTPAALWEGIKTYYNPTTEEGQGHIAGDLTIAILTGKFMAGAMPKTAPAIKVEAELPKAPTTTALAPYYPPNNGALGTETYRLFSPGDKIARYGSEYGSYTTDVGTPPQMLSLPPNQIGRPESIYMFKTYFWAYESKAAPWFGQIGGGTQYRFPLSIDELIKNEIISRW